MFENVITTGFHMNYMGSWIKWIQHYEDETGRDDDIEKLRFIQNTQIIGLLIFEESVDDESYVET
jgi:hypothetical protein